ncbi:DUF3575 domain-containing protein [Dysgonomonas sp. GY75]|uniref:DUF3575 domain-containing protein n=1 Tax=Dysgonomonas sp. GY75 TaxID=2780419 RepID=UPI001883BDA5|nr:DUF3575 domain-containing protein [Dysgonomonas sp. GY75]MBF0647871.1 DUF3575 domain-containing protein [Dysgonomonas sp. GY75]
MKQSVFTVLLLMICLFPARGQDKASYLPLAAPRLAVKTNLLYDATTTLNLGLEVRLKNRYTLDLSVNYNPFTYSGNRKLKHILVQPELRYWSCEPFYGHFIGVHALYANYNTGNIKLPLDIFPGLETGRYRGNLYGAGISYGYHWMLSPRWNLEATIGVGYVYTDYDRYECKTCGKLLDSGNKHYFGPTKAGISFIYIIK